MKTRCHDLHFTGKTYAKLGGLDESEHISPKYETSELLIKSSHGPDKQHFVLETAENNP